MFTKIKTILAAQGYAMRDIVIVKLTMFVAGDPKLGGKMDFAGMERCGPDVLWNLGLYRNGRTLDRPGCGVGRSGVLVEIEATAAK